MTRLRLIALSSSAGLLAGALLFGLSARFYDWLTDEEPPSDARLAELVSRQNDCEEMLISKEQAVLVFQAIYKKGP